MNYNWRLSMPDKLIKKSAEVAEGKLERGWGMGGVYKFEIKNKNKLKSEQ